MVTDGNGLDPGDALDGAGPGASLAGDDDEPGVGRVGDGDGLVADGVGEWPVCRSVGVGLAVCVGVGVAVGVVAGEADAVSADGGRTCSQRANTAMNSPVSTRVEVRGRCPKKLTRRPQSRGRRRARRRR